MAVHAEPMAAPVERRVSARATRRPAPRVGPWTRKQCRALAFLHAVVLAVIVGSYWKSSRQAHPSDQLTWLNLSVVAMLVAGGADALFFARGHRATSRMRRRIFAPAPIARDMTDRQDTFVAVEGTRRYHVAGCAFVVGKAVTAAPGAHHTAAGRSPCEVCRPGGES
jgi:hypothetical protein